MVMLCVLGLEIAFGSRSHVGYCMFQLHVSYSSIISIGIKGIILFQNYRFVSRVSLTSLVLKFY